MLKLRVRARVAAAAAATGALLGGISAAPAMADPSGAAGLPWQVPPITVRAPVQAPVQASRIGADIVNLDYTGWGLDGEGSWPAPHLGMVRIWTDYTTWSDIEPMPGQWRFSLLDRQVNEAVARHSAVLYVLGETPSWATSEPLVASEYGMGAPAPPRSMADWTNYVATVASRYRGRIAAYELWDEIDGATFAGTPKEMVALAATAYATIKRVDPRAIVLTPSFTQDAITSGWLGAYLAAGGARYADALAAHAYPEDPEQGGAYLLAYEATLQKAGVHLPVWMTEIGYSGFDASGNPSYSPAEAQALVARTVMDQVEGGAAAVIWYGANANSMWVSLGSQGYPGDGAAYSSMVQWLSGTTPLGCGGITTGPYAGLAGCYLRSADGQLEVLLYDFQGTIDLTTPGVPLSVSTVDGLTSVLPPGSSITVGAVPVKVAVAEPARG
jgi:hypothetical protein